ncbi:hypothetical protein CWI38_0284p0080 [Hamiltosporidium tvaerminnensis]|uniref:Uncharacterized protein n=1 Tax=Hamiltosporidium tvaerminnensis TaxID=1176355 RepID=A0A4Q9LUF2_9MICR|nr:hypothetical protein CWI38_1231p0010 [Hamiltosporidium tvaerminnensis]TBU17613.1 hypothetical protein CWI38_0284p0080 [Hamiltosporidium tvaerminnensis]
MVNAYNMRRDNNVQRACLMFKCVPNGICKRHLPNDEEISNSKSVKKEVESIKDNSGMESLYDLCSELIECKNVSLMPNPYN